MANAHVLSLCVTLLACTAAATAQNWTGAMDSNWNNAANWSEWPLDGENVTIDPALYVGLENDPVLGGASAFVPDRLFIENGASVELAAGLTVADRMIISDEAVVVMSAGTLTTDRLIMELGGLFTLDGGTVNALGVLALGDDGTLPSSFIQNGGTVNVSGEFGFDVELEPSSPTYRLVSGSLTVNGDAVWFGASPGSGQGRLLVEGGNAQINGSVMNTNSSTVDLFIGISGGELTVNGPTLDLAHNTDSLMQSSGNLVLDNALVFENDGVVHATGGDLLVHGDAELRGVGSTRFHHVTVSTGAALQHTAPDELEVGGHWMLAGAFDADNNTVTFLGTTEQTVSATPFHGLRVNNDGPGITLGPGTTTVAGALVLDAGVVHTTNSAMLQLQQGATATAGSAASLVDGPLRKVGNDYFLFPVGKQGAWRRVGITGINDQDTEFTAEYFPQGYANTTALADGLTSVSSTEHWSLARAVTTDEARVALYWEDAAASNIDDCDMLAVAHWDGTLWNGAPSNTTGSCAGNDAGGVASDDGVPNYDVFTFGTSDGTLSVEEQSSSAAYRPAPQPADASTWLPLPAKTTDVMIHDLTGELIFATKQDLRGTSGLRLDTSAMTTGLYVARILHGAQVLATTRLMVVH